MPSFATFESIFRKNIPLWGKLVAFDLGTENVDYNQIYEVGFMNFVVFDPATQRPARDTPWPFPEAAWPFPVTFFKHHQRLELGLCAGCFQMRMRANCDGSMTLEPVHNNGTCWLHTQAQRTTCIEAVVDGQEGVPLYAWIQDLVRAILLKTFGNICMDKSVLIQSSSRADARTFSFRIANLYVPFRNTSGPVESIYDFALNVFNSYQPAILYDHSRSNRCFYSSDPEVHPEHPSDQTKRSIAESLRYKMCDGTLLTIKQMNQVSDTYAALTTAKVQHSFEASDWDAERILAWQAHGMDFVRPLFESKASADHRELHARIVRQQQEATDSAGSNWRLGVFDTNTDSGKPKEGTLAAEWAALGDEYVDDGGEGELDIRIPIRTFTLEEMSEYPVNRGPFSH
ncbi:hypothetical protein PMZ80_010820 [Knufia obscura]|uniref:Uncharacterized protein n=1 Tax=Knufia obscura TaxID=1635080 RepID=A0ABR0R8D2_9EURO|nr:hypothetical protein PMZ80_010820 [Knufia obscura]